MSRRIVCAAIRNKDGVVVCGPRHFDMTMVKVLQVLPDASEPWEQGFVDQKGEFLTREDAWVVATAASQIVRRCGNDEGRLFSENLY